MPTLSYREKENYDESGGSGRTPGVKVSGEMREGMEPYTKQRCGLG